jgi:L-threonylcarbamoyladenylate synthase
MRIIPLSELQQSPHLYEEIADILRKDGTVCFPTPSTYRIATPFLSEKAVISFLQMKRRTRKAPSLVMIPDTRQLKKLVSAVPQEAQHLIERFWPGDLTLIFEMGEDVPKKIRKNLQNNGRIGVRIPEDRVTKQIVQAFGSPLLVSSANLADKHGATSEAQVRKNFGRWVDILISAGDLPGNQVSTVVDATCQPLQIMRPGAIGEQQILAAWQQAAAA